MKNFWTQKQERERITFFDPRGIVNYLYAYPELKKIKEFRKLQISELKFVWWVSNSTSDMVDKESKFYIKDEQLRTKEAIDICIGGILPKIEKERWIDGFLPDNIKSAISRMKKINPTVRMEAFGMVEKVFTEYKNVVNDGMVKFTIDGNADVKKYVETVKTIIAELPSLIELLETGYGYTRTKNTLSEGFEGQANITSYLKNKKGS